jgi:2-amino-4-hydroxy-6-hydroxymethyldihydropteridine diphosphokinase
LDGIKVAVALGSNLGDRERYLREAVDELRPFISDLTSSTFYDTAPIGVGDQPRFLNAAAIGATTLSARALLEKLLSIEAKFGRTRPHPGAARTLDLDLILYGDQIIEERGQTVPPPPVRVPRVVFEPRGEKATDRIDPGTNRNV